MTEFSLSSVTVVSVCYKSDALIYDMIASIPDQTPIVLVDNGQSNRFSNLPAQRNIRVVKLSENVGFGRGCNAGASIVDTPWIIFLNPDARLMSDALESLLEAAKHYPLAAAFNPRIANADGSAYFKRRSWLLPRRQYMAKGWPAADSKVPVLSGAAFFVSKENFEKVGGFDPNIFLYHEDDDLSLRLSQLGQLMFVRKSLVVHAAGHSSGRSPEVARLKAFHMARSRIYTGIKHKRPFPRITTFLQALALVFSPITLFSARRRAKALGFLEGTMNRK
ncbi:glycosyltransferase family 2 protein [Agrobacterium genomosp. 3 str. CIP 111-78]|uniref:Glycosyltransferase family 2 protein n=1 Tax=Agrobacterium tumefaciens TaxID=358 RepID=A0AAE6BTD6_AGRTU|nr:MULTISPECIES: glycosyltransferase family 2 protein [Agrobacterium tumefaciens complex]MCA2371579.1 glycosyltransferase family 2 protein [Agrobacterium tomkonis CIP 111-78]QCM03086.1 glycosyltransferase family 2 protein [Agrobacterium tumefaciens]